MIPLGIGFYPLLIPLYPINDPIIYLSICPIVPMNDPVNDPLHCLHPLEKNTLLVGPFLTEQLYHLAMALAACRKQRCMPSTPVPKKTPRGFRTSTWGCHMILIVVISLWFMVYVLMVGGRYIYISIHTYPFLMNINWIVTLLANM